MNRRDTNFVNSSNAGNVSATATTKQVLQTKPMPAWRNTTRYNHQQTRVETLSTISSPQPKKIIKPTTTSTVPRSNSESSSPQPSVRTESKPNSSLLNKRPPFITSTARRPNVNNSIRGTTADKRALLQRAMGTAKKMSQQPPSSRKGTTVAATAAAANNVQPNSLNVILPPLAVKSKTESSIDSEMLTRRTYLLTDSLASKPVNEFVSFNIQVDAQKEATENANNDPSTLFSDDKKDDKMEIVSIKNETLIVDEKENEEIISQNLLTDESKIEPITTIIVTAPSQPTIEIEKENNESSQESEIIVSDQDIVKDSSVHDRQENQDEVTVTSQQEDLNAADPADVTVTDLKEDNFNSKTDAHVMGQEKEDFAGEIDAIVTDQKNEDLGEETNSIVSDQQAEAEDVETDNAESPVEALELCEEINFITSPIYFVSAHEEESSPTTDESQPEESTVKEDADKLTPVITEPTEDENADKKMDNDASKDEIDHDADQLIESENDLSLNTGTKIIVLKYDIDKSTTDNQEDSLSGTSKDKDETSISDSNDESISNSNVLEKDSSASLADPEEFDSTTSNNTFDQDAPTKQSSNGASKLKRNVFSI